MNEYFPFKGNKGTAVAVELFSSSQNVPLHTHEFEELVLVARGTCSHKFLGKNTPLMPGDVFLVPSHRPHSYQIPNNLTVYNVQFYPNKLENRLGALWGELKPNRTVPELSQTRMLTISGSSANARENSESHYIFSQHDMNHFGVLRLNMQETAYVIATLERMQIEQQSKTADYERIMHAYLEILLVLLMRVKTRESTQDIEPVNASANSMVMDAMAYIEDHYTETINFKQIANTSYLSLNYFRTVFKKVTGFPPIDYLNRLRIIKSMRYLQKDGIPIAQVSALVGIADPNYYSRLFKRITGCSPRQFKG